MTVSQKIRGLFWSPHDDPAGPPPPAPVSGGALDADFGAIYARTSTAGEPQVDQVLAAFEAMKSAMPAEQLAIAVAATAHAIGADPASVVQTVHRRLQALDGTVVDEQRKSGARQAARATQLEAMSATVRSEAQALEAKIAALRDQLSTATTAAHQEAAHEQGVVVAFEQRARAESARLVALRDFLSPPTKRR